MNKQTKNQHRIAHKLCRTYNLTNLSLAEQNREYL